MALRNVFPLLADCSGLLSLRTYRCVQYKYAVFLSCVPKPIIELQAVSSQFSQLLVFDFSLGLQLVQLWKKL
jgi:hypothetical protein